MAVATIGECAKGFRKQKFLVASNLMDLGLKNKGPPLKQARIPAIAGAHCYRETTRYNWQRAGISRELPAIAGRTKYCSLLCKLNFTCLASFALTKKIHPHLTHNLSTNQMHGFKLGEINNKETQNQTNQKIKRK